MKVLSLYSSWVKRRPLTSQVITAGLLTTVGDVIAQKIENQPSGYSLKRTLVMSGLGFGYFGPIVTAWLMFLKRLKLQVIPTVLCDQLIAAPVVNAGFVFIHPVLSGRSLNEAKDIFKSSYMGIMSKSWMLWFPVQTINFSLIPFEFRMLYIQTVALAWNTFLSYQSNASLADTATD